MERRRIIGQCDTATFRSVEHLIRVWDNPEQLDLTTLKPKQKIAVIVTCALMKAGLKLEEICRVKSVLFWSDGTWTWKFYSSPASKAVREKLLSPDMDKAIAHALDSIVPGKTTDVSHQGSSQVSKEDSHGSHVKG